MGNLAFILKVEPHRELVTLLDQVAGKLVLSSKRFNRAGQLAVTGALISYEIHSHRKGLESASILLAPLVRARQELLFIHQIIAVCYYCLPFGAPDPEIFRILSFVLETQQVPLATVSKKILILLVFWQCGVLSLDIGDAKFINYLLSETLEDILKANYTITENELDRWLHACIQLHPQREKLKIVLRGK